MAQKQPQVLNIEPSELRFSGPYNDVVTTYLKISNPSTQRVCYKVKTTAPRRYCVRPNCGFLEPGSQADVSVMLQPREPGAFDKTKHKFMVQSMYAPANAGDVDSLWGTASPNDLMDTKIRCIFEGEGADDVVKLAGQDPGSDTTSKPSLYQGPGSAKGQATATQGSNKMKVIVIIVLALALGLAAAYVMLMEE